jgi:glutathione S-transferase
MLRENDQTSRTSFSIPISIALLSDTIQFLAINPNGRIPALTDTFTDGQKINLFESGSIMQYLVDRYDTEHKISFPKGTREYYEMNNWLFFQNAGVGPMQGQASE